MRNTFKSLALGICFATLGGAHIGSPDVYFEGFAGPYKLFVTIRPPQVVPGIADLEVRSQSRGVTRVQAVPLPLSEGGAKRSPTPDTLHVSGDDPQFFAGNLWLMSDGSWEISLSVSGSQGSGVLAVPVPAIARSTRQMKWQLSAALSLLGIFLVAGLVAIAGASVREAKLATGLSPDQTNISKGRVAMAVALAIIVLMLWGGKTWWASEASEFQNRVYKPLAMRAELSGNSVLSLRLSEPGWMQPKPGRSFRESLFVRRMDDLVPDHNHIMHLYAIRQPGLDVVYHLHPDRVGPSEFRLALPEMPAGSYQLYADVVHQDGLPETLTATLALPAGASTGRALSGDDARGESRPVDSAAPSDRFVLPDGYQMRWIHGKAPLRARSGSDFRFELLTPDGSAPKDMALYMGMLGHAAFVKTDGTVFAHVHPNGSAPMAALALTQQASMSMPQNDMPSMSMSLPNEVAFPYGLPSSGQYRVFVQMKHGQTIETGVFDLIAE